jgi:hypothetical protein
LEIYTINLTRLVRFRSHPLCMWLAWPWRRAVLAAGGEPAFGPVDMGPLQQCYAPGKCRVALALLLHTRRPQQQLPFA